MELAISEEIKRYEAVEKDYSNFIYSLIAPKISNKSTVEDVIQEVKIALYLWVKKEQQTPSRALVAKITHNKIVDHYRQKKSEETRVAELIKNKGQLVSASPLPTSLKETLTGRQYQILKLLSIGASNKEIAQTLYISQNTLRTHLRKLYKHFGTSNRFKISLLASRLFVVL